MKPAFILCNVSGSWNSLYCVQAQLICRWHPGKITLPCHFTDRGGW